MNADADRLYAFLELFARGRSRAMRQAKIAAELDWRDGHGDPDTRRVQKALVALVVGDPPRVVCSAIHEPMGSFIPKDLSEAIPYLRQLHERGIECLKHEKKVRDAMAQMFGTEIQESMFEEVAR